MRIIERIFDRLAVRGRRRTIAFTAIGAVLAGSATFAVSQVSTSSATAPLPAALAGQSLVTQFDPSTLVSSTWNPTNQPGNCPTANNGAKINSSGWAEIDTTGATNDCRSIQSPQASLSTAPGTTYEALINFSSFHDWPAFWMYGPNWPNQGEIDAVEGGPGTSYVTWHQAGNHTVGPDAWDNTVVPYAGISHDIQPGVWTTVDISFTTTGVDVYYNGTLYVHIPETVTTSGNDPMFLTISEGSCSAEGANVCNGGTSPAGSVQTQWVREFSSSGGGSTPTPTPTPTTPTPTPTTTSTPVTIYACEDGSGNVTAITAGTAPTCPTGDKSLSWSALAQ
jgi:hypothetical protein